MTDTPDDCPSDFIDGYIAALLFTDAGPDDECADMGADDFAPETLARIEADCAAFWQRAGAILDRIESTSRFVRSGGCSDLEMAGHDFWLTRNRHGAGFWDGDWPEPEATTLTALAHEAGETWVYKGDDGKIHLG